jgi:hypothetical protein
LFGEVELRVAGHVLDVGTPRRQAVLAALIVDAGRPVAIEALIDRRRPQRRCRCMGLMGMRCSSMASSSIIENTVTIPATVEAA